MTRHSIARLAIRHSRCRYASTVVSGQTGQELSKAREFCYNLIRKYDYPASINQAFIPPSARDAFLALRAFNIETARVADHTSHASIGQMRMDFWRKTVASSLAGTPPAEPVAILLAYANESLQARTDGRTRLSKSWLTKIINTREKYLGNPPYPTLTSLEQYAEDTYSTLLYLTLQAFPVQSLTVDHIASHIGKATGIVAVLRGLPLVAFPPPAPTHHTSNTSAGPLSAPPQGAVLIPLEVMAEAGLREEDVFREGASAPGLKDAVFTVATRANDHLITAREMLSNLRKGQDVGHDFEHVAEPEFEESRSQSSNKPAKQLEEVQTGFPALLPAVATKLWLERLEKNDFDVFSEQLRRSDWKLPWRSWRANSQRDV